MQAVEVSSASKWNQLIQTLPDPHILQTWEWGQSKIKNGWHPKTFVWRDSDNRIQGATLLLERQQTLLPGLTLRVLYCPKGPLLDWEDKALTQRVLADLEAYTKQRKALLIKIDPDVKLGEGIPNTENARENPGGQDVRALMQQRLWRYSPDQVQFSNTVLLDLTKTEDELLAAMKQKTRYNIRLAARKGVQVRQGSLTDLPLLYDMYAETAVRDDFVIRGESYYLDLWTRFMQAGMCTPLLAEVEGKTVAAIVLFHFGGIARYLYGMSLPLHREFMPNYLLQWEGIQLAKAMGCHSYDFWGAPFVFDESDSMAGVYRFKEGFNGVTTRYLGAYDYAPKPAAYRAYTTLLPKLLNLMRSRGKALNRKAVHD
ncbi:MAG: lipid II:glycine glycyltransferase FemX [Anaerolineaceae bacterium]|jgi:peptidoglycan pentaglycine glycine transferase (the first glycine)